MEVKKFKLKALKSFLRHIDQKPTKIEQGKEFFIDYLTPFWCSRIRVGDVVIVNEPVAKSKEAKNGD